jgi:hypothetical protein
MYMHTQRALQYLVSYHAFENKIIRINKRETCKAHFRKHDLSSLFWAVHPIPHAPCLAFFFCVYEACHFASYRKHQKVDASVHVWPIRAYVYMCMTYTRTYYSCMCSHEQISARESALAVLNFLHQCFQTAAAEQDASARCVCLT